MTWWMGVLSQTGVDGDVWAPLLNLGVAGIFVVLFVSGRIHSEKEVAAIRKECESTAKALRDERDDAVADARKLRDTLIEQAVPAMTRATEAAVRATEVLVKGPRQ